MGVKARKDGFRFGSPPSVKKLDIEKFKGVDFSNNPIQVDLSRSPDCVNMISDLTGFPVKRYGYRKVSEFPTGSVHGIYKLVTTGVKKFIVHHGNKLYEMDSLTATKKEIYTDMNNESSTGVQFNGKIYILDGKTFLVYGNFGTKESPKFECKKVSETAKIPKTIISRNPKGGGHTYEDVNMLSAKRTNSFLGTASDREYLLDFQKLDTEKVTAKVLKSDGTWKDLKEDTDFTVDREKGKVTFKVVPGKSPIDGRDNVEITGAKTNQEYLDKLNKCTIMAIYTYRTGDWLFLSGNAQYPNLDWHSNVNDATYFSDLSYQKVGQENSEIMSYMKVGTGLAIMKTDNDQDYTVYIRSADFTEKGNMIFPLTQGIVGVGAISKRATASLRDDSLFLAKDGVTAVATRDVLGERFAQNRSYYINQKLLREKDLKNAIAIEHDGCYYLAVNNHVYIADGRQGFKGYNPYAQNNESFQYEWYYWENVPVNCWFEDEKDLYFGTVDGKIYKFYNDNDSERNKYLDDDKPINAYWTTPFLDFGDITRYKTLKGLWVMLNPYLRSSCDIFYRAKGRTKKVKSAYLDIFSFENIDFERFSFNTDDTPLVVPTNAKEKKFMLIQFKIQNKESEPFGIYKMQTTYTINSKFKG